MRWPFSDAKTGLVAVVVASVAVGVLQDSASVDAATTALVAAPLSAMVSYPAALLNAAFGSAVSSRATAVWEIAPLVVLLAFGLAWYVLSRYLALS